MRVAALAPVVAAALALTGCGGSGSKGSTGQTGTAPAATAPAATTPAGHRALTSLDLINIVGEAPDTPAGAAYSADSTTTTLTLVDLARRATSAGEKATVAGFRKAGFRLIYQRSFNGALNTADGTTYLFRSGPGAAQGLSLLRVSLAKPGSVSQRVTPVTAGALGAGAWAAHVTGGTEGAVFLWRRNALVIVADMSCDGACDFDVVKATRSWAGAIDARARATG